MKLGTILLNENRTRTSSVKNLDQIVILIFRRSPITIIHLRRHLNHITR